jgi:malonate transporter and related proteins
MHDIALNVIPVFLLILIGWALVRSRFLKASVGVDLGEFVFKVAVPVLIFHTITNANFQGASPFRLWIAYFAGVTVTWAVGQVIATRIFGRDSRIGVLAGVSSAFANNVFIGLPLVSHIIGNEGLVPLSILLAVHLPLMMVIGTVLMEHADAKENGSQTRSIIAVLRQVGHNLITNPLVIGVAAGLCVQLTGLPIPTPIETVLSQIATMAGPAALISLGMALTQYRITGNLGITAVTSALKLFLLPSTVWGACLALGLSSEWTKALVLTSSVPTGVNAWLIANRFGVGHALAASTITITTILGVFSVTFWAWFLGT